MRLFLVRHGDPDYDKDCLTELGHRQADVVAQRLLEEGIEAIYSSPMGRARQTAQPFAEASGIGKINILDFMKEIRYRFCRRWRNILHIRHVLKGACLFFHFYNALFCLNSAENGRQS